MNFNWPVRVYYEDTDSGGVVYYANYLKFMERARTEYLRQLGFDQVKLIENDNIIFAVRSVNVDYRKPARFNDELEVTSKVVECKKASMLFEQQVIRKQDAVLLVEATVLIASINADTFKPCSLPENMREIISVS